MNQHGKCTAAAAAEEEKSGVSNKAPQAKREEDEGPRETRADNV